MATDQSMANVKALIKQRTTIKSQVTRIGSYVKEKSDSNFGELEARKEKLEQLWNAYNEIQGEIEALDETTDYTSESKQFEQHYYEIKALFVNRMPNSQFPNRGASSSKAVNSSSVKQANTLLPKIEIKPFDGNPIDWHSFYDTFKDMVHNNEDLLTVQKFHFLKNSLRGEVASIVAPLAALEENYEVAWNLLQKRCNKPRQILHAHLRLLFELPEIQRDTPSNLRLLSEKAQMHVQALTLLKEPVEHWGTILVFIIANKLDKHTRKVWDRTLENEERPTFDQLINFIDKQARSDEVESTIVSPVKGTHQDYRIKGKIPSRGQAYLATGKQLACVFCKQGHENYYCPQFIQLSVQERLSAVKRARVCLNCLRSNHMVSNCKSMGCRKCNRRHHSLLHFNNEARVTIPDSSKAAGSSPSGSASRENATSSTETIRTALTVLFDSEVLLGTAQVKILDNLNEEHCCRVLLDGGSQAHFISERLVDRLKIKKQEINLTFSGLSKLITRARYYVKSVIKSRDNTFATELRFIVLPTITGLLPARQIDRRALSIPNNINLADPEFHMPSEIDLLLGNTLFYRVLSIGQIRTCNENIILQKTRLGWLVTGEVESQGEFIKQDRVKMSYLVTSLDKQIERFWEIEELPTKQFFSPEELECENHFKENTCRDSNGRYIVRLPFNDKKDLLGESKTMALKRFYSLERKLHQNPELLRQYIEFLDEYRVLGHMYEITTLEDNKNGFYLPHHAVVKESSATTKVRVVFDASAKSSSGISLNEALLVGPTIQDTLFTILLRFRIHSYVFTADIEKMFRQIKVHSSDVTYQRILWRESMDKPIKTYALNTVTCGTASAPYLAVSCLNQLAEDEINRFPIASRILRRDFYMDDVLTGASSLEEALVLRNELIALTKTGGFHLRQWTSNSIKLIEDLDTQNNLKSLSLDSSEAKKTLGVFWKPSTDTIIYTTKAFVGKTRITKRLILSEISQLFDPLGLLGPVIIKAKIIIQQLWKANITWDEPVPQNISCSWLDNHGQSRILRRDFYMDNVLTGASSLEEALVLRNELIALTKTGGFHLRQWTSNSIKLIEDLDTQNNLKSLSLESSEAKKTLGVFWKPSTDTIIYTTKAFVGKTRITKRLILSEISQLFDPLGLLGPVIIKAKIIIQQLWKANITWDEPVPQNISCS
ncbi:PREDICTED: uncharacterized protein LOC107188906, partial [Dufourea novaeangliae]|uniref:uncharacterized protein LOC107188906 n=1 Tax=Dufourea novaeangliae TaxID=178035 RepID=UPI0007676E40